MRLKYHKEYRKVFSEIYRILREEKVDYIVHTGDIFHSKLELTPECTRLAIDFLSDLSDIAPVYIIPGNHDVNMNNKERLDSITPIVKALNIGNKNINYLHSSTIVNVENTNINFKVFSMLDEYNWPNITMNRDEHEGIVIALYHGCLRSSQTDLGQKLDGEHGLELFQGCDYGFLGDIHKTNQIMDADGRFRYVGSTIQQNHGETDDKGILIWDIKDKRNYECKHIVIPNPSPFFTIRLNEDGGVPKDLDVPKNAKVRVILEHSIPLDKVEKTIKKIKEVYHPNSVTFINNSKTLNFKLAKKFSDKENVRDLNVQENYIKEYISEYSPSKKVSDNILNLNKKFSVSTEPEIQRNINWHITSMRWNNMFNYNEDNLINFDNLNGVVGIFGPNYSGKSSVIDTLLYSVFNQTTKKTRKNLNLINDAKDEAEVELKFTIDKEQYSILRKIEKTKKKSKGQVITESRTTVDFNSTSDKLNGIDRSDTDKAIKNILGTYDDFLLTSLSSQFGSLSFINDGSAQRKETLSRFLDLDFFDEKYQKAKEESAELKVMIKKMEKTDYQAEIDKLTNKITSGTAPILEKKQDLQRLKDQLELVTKEHILLDSKIKEASKQVSSLPFEKVEERYNKLTADAKTLGIEIADLEDSIKLHETSIERAEESLKRTDVEALKTKKENYTALKTEFDLIERELDKVMIQAGSLNNKVKLLDEVPCGDSFKQCKFIKDAHNAKIELVPLNSKISATTTKRDFKQSELDAIDIKNINWGINNYDEMKKSHAKLTQTLNSRLQRLNESNAKLIIVNNDLVKVKAEYDSFKSSDQLWEDKRQLNILTSKISVQKTSIVTCEQEIEKMKSVMISDKTKLDHIIEEKKQYENNLEEYSAYDLYIKAMHPSGVPFEIVKKHLPIINSEIEKILSSVAEFNVYMEAESDKLEIYIEHPNQEPRPIELGSGAEKMLASIAIRLALINITTLPKSDIFILDEPGTALDSKNLEMFTRVLELLKTQFRTVFLITHLEQLKDSVDFQILLDKNEEGIAHINI